MIIYSRYHYYTYMKQKSWSNNMSSGSDRWVEFNDFRVKTMPNGWSEIINNCLMSNAYPSVLVYEKMDESDLKE